MPRGPPGAALSGLIRNGWLGGQQKVLLAGGVSIARQALAAGLVDEVVLHVVPKLIGGGVRLFDSAQGDLRCVDTIQGEGAVHLRYEVR